MSEPQTFVLVNERVRANATAALRAAPDRHVVSLSPPSRSKDQNKKFHAICRDFERSQIKWFGKRRDFEEWKVLLISGHAKVTDNKGDVIPGLEGELVAIRESTASMTVGRAASLISYAIAYAVMNGVELTETRAGGFLEPAEAA